MKYFIWYSINNLREIFYCFPLIFDLINLAVRLTAIENMTSTLNKNYDGTWLFFSKIRSRCKIPTLNLSNHNWSRMIVQTTKYTCTHAFNLYRNLLEVPYTHFQGEQKYLPLQRIKALWTLDRSNAVRFSIQVFLWRSCIPHTCYRSPYFGDNTSGMRWYLDEVSYTYEFSIFLFSLFTAKRQRIFHTKL